MRASIPSTAVRLWLDVLASFLALSLWLNSGSLATDFQPFTAHPDAGMQLADPGGGSGHTG